MSPDENADQQAADAAPKVFVSYSSADREAAENLVEQLETRGVSCWIAPRNVRAGSKYAEEIISGIECSEVFVLLLSQESNDSDHVQREVERAADRDKPIIPVRLEDLEPSGTMDYFLAGLHRVDAFKGESKRDFSSVAKDIADRLAVSAPPQPSASSPSSPSSASATPSPPSPRSKSTIIVLSAGLGLVVIALLGIGISKLMPPSPGPPGKSIGLPEIREQIEEGRIFEARDHLKKIMTASQSNPEADAAMQEIDHRREMLGPETTAELESIPDDLELELWIEGGSRPFAIETASGTTEGMPLFIRSNKDCHIVVISRTKLEGNVVDLVLYPNEVYRETLLEAGFKRAIPGEEYGELKGSEPGVDVIYAVAASEKSVLEKFLQAVKVSLGEGDEPFVVFGDPAAPSGAKPKGLIIDRTNTAGASKTIQYAKRVISIETVE